jgi:hypothetical protein
MQKLLPTQTCQVLRIEARVVGLVTLARNRSRVAEQMVTTLYFFFFIHYFWRVQWVDSLA